MAKRVVVVGSGAAGMFAAVAAATEGAEVTVLEAASSLGGTTALSGGGVWIPANPWSAAQGARDSVEDAIRYMRTVARGDSDGAVIEAYAHEGLRVARLVEERTPIRWQHLLGMLDYNPEADGACAD